MRITNSMLINTVLRDLNTNMGKMSKSQEQLSSGRRINRPSDDPVGLVDSLRLRTGLTELDKYTSNAEDAKSWLETSDSSLDEAGKIVIRIRELAVQGANGATMPQTALDAISMEVSQLKQQLVNIGNTTYAGKYVFSGAKTQTAAFTAAGVYQGDANSLSHEIGIGTLIPKNVTGTQAFGNLFTVVDSIINNLNTGNTVNISATDLAQLDAVEDQQLQVRADIGARVNRLEFAINRMDAQNVNMTQLLSKAEDADATEVMTQLKVQENVYRSSLSAGARIVQPTLMDFLR